MKSWKRTARRASSVLALASLAALGAAAQAITHTPWEVHEGEGVVKLDRAHANNGDKEAYAKANVPAADDSGWVKASQSKIKNSDGTSMNDKTIGLKRASLLGKDYSNCKKAANYTYFQTYVDLPANTTVSEFKIKFEGMDDGSRISIYNSANPNGKIVEGSYVKLNAAGTSDLKDELVTGSNRVVITQVDDCASANNLRSATVSLNGQTLQVEEEPESGDVISKLTPGTKIATGTAYASNDQSCNLTLQPDGNVVLRDKSGGFLWGSYNDLGVPLQVKSMSFDGGNLVLKDGSGKTLWQSGTSGSDSRLSCTGKTVRVVGGDGGVKWSSDQVKEAEGSGSVDDIKPGTKMEVGKKYWNKDKTLYVTLQHDGNMVVRDKNEGFKWGSYNNNKVALDARGATFGPDGNFKMTNGSGGQLWESGAKGGNARVSIDDGTFKVIEGEPVVVPDPTAPILAYSINNQKRGSANAAADQYITIDGGVGKISNKAAPFFIREISSDAKGKIVAFESAAGQFIAAEDNTSKPAASSDVKGVKFYLRPALETAAGPGFFSLESVDVPGEYLRHQGYVLKLDKIDANSPSLAKRDATWSAPVN